LLVLAGNFLLPDRRLGVRRAARISDLVLVPAPDGDRRAGFRRS